MSPSLHLPARPGAQHLPSSSSGPCSSRPALAAPLPQAGGPSVGTASWGTEHAGLASLLQVTTRAGGQAQDSPLSAGHATAVIRLPCSHRIPSVAGESGAGQGQCGTESSGRTGCPCPLTADPGPSSGALPGSLSPLPLPCSSRRASCSWCALLPQVRPLSLPGLPLGLHPRASDLAGKGPAHPSGRSRGAPACGLG